LELCHVAYESDKRLTALTALSRLSLNDILSLPRRLLRLTGLQSLALHQLDAELAEEQAEQLQQALSLLRHLTDLALQLNTELPAELATQSLRSFCWRPCTRGYPELVPAPGPLPGGSWLAGLQSLAAPCDVLASSLQVLPAAQQLTCLCALKINSEVTRKAALVVWWAVAQPHIQELILEEAEPLNGSAMVAVEAAAVQRPDLDILQCEDVFGQLLWDF